MSSHCKPSSLFKLNSLLVKNPFPILFFFFLFSESLFCSLLSQLNNYYYYYYYYIIFHFSLFTFFIHFSNFAQSIYRLLFSMFIFFFLLLLLLLFFFCCCFLFFFHSSLFHSLSIFLLFRTRFHPLLTSFFSFLISSHLPSYFCYFSSAISLFLHLILSLFHFLLLPFYFFLLSFFTFSPLSLPPLSLSPSLSLSLWLFITLYFLSFLSFF
ncbi:unnamed protein product [Acanthosepion pharaonis]|uniref:Uncharacterized protein n=1 Tax=Acanthosepion pharaonis TaxID=158019 RepID=A0A812EHE2_ACAPH|nr:unnamed protein product [Sepia pharaonis]